MAGLYVHVPFCLKKCNYCDFCSFEGLSHESREAYISALKREVLLYAQNEKNKIQVETVFFGGGTPSLLTPREFYEICESLASTFDISRSAEFTVEANPKTLTAELLREYCTCGVNRISIGLQSIHENELKKLGRIHSYPDFLHSFKLVEKSGISNVNVDVMYGIPEQTLKSFSETLKALTALSVPHLSVYGLMIEEGTPFARDVASLQLPNEDEEAAMYYEAARLLAERAYRHYEISNYALAGHECRHNLKYWRAEEYIGLGVSAYSYFGGVRYGNTSSLSEYLAADMFSYRNAEKSSPSDRAFEYAMLALRLDEGLNFADYERRFGVDFRLGREEKLEKYKRLGLLSLSARSVALTTAGFYVSNTILADLL